MMRKMLRLFLTTTWHVVCENVLCHRYPRKFDNINKFYFEILRKPGDNEKN